MVNIGNDWDSILKGEFEKEYYQNMRKFLVKEYKTKTIYPKPEEIFSAFKLKGRRKITPFIAEYI